MGVVFPPGWTLSGLGTYLVFDGPDELRASAEAGGVTVTVTTEWSARFLVDGEVANPLPGRTVADTYDLMVEERRAVRTRGPSPINSQ